jgi:tetratricopeptide (TPR) repeat protein
VARASGPHSDRYLNRLIVGSILVLLVGIPLLTVVYMSDRWVDRGPTLAERRIQDLESAVRASPNVISTRLQLAGAYTAAGRESDALTQLNEVIKVQPDSKTALLARGDMFHRQGNLDAAAKDYQAIADLVAGTEFAPEDTELEAAFYGLGSIELDRSRPADAVGFLVDALQIDGANADTLYLLGRAYLDTGQSEKAVSSLRTAVAFVPTDWCEPYQALHDAYAKQANAPEAAWAAAMVAFCREQPDAAKRQLESLVSGPAATDAFLGLGMIAESQSDAAAAASAYRQVLARDPGSFNAEAGLSRVVGAAPSPSPPGIPDVPSVAPSIAPAALSGG